MKIEFMYDEMSLGLVICRVEDAKCRVYDFTLQVGHEGVAKMVTSHLNIERPGITKYQE